MCPLPNGLSPGSDYYLMNLAITAIFQNEAPYLKEWIDFHLSIGVTYFHLFDNLSTDQPEDVLAPYIAQGVVRLTSWPLTSSDVYEWTEVQCLAYERAIHSACGKIQWLAVLDVDEFLFPVQDPILNTLHRFKEYGGICVNWQVFGTSNLPRIPEGKKMIEVLNAKARTDHVTNHYVKTIVRPECVKKCENAHSMTYHPGFYQVDTDGNRFEGCLSPSVKINELRINHYTLRDEYFLKTQKMPRLQKWWKQGLIDLKNKHAEMNLVEDKEIHRFLYTARD